MRSGQKEPYAFGMTHVTHCSRPTTDELTVMSELADDRLRDFFGNAVRLSPAQLRMLTRSSCASTLTPLSLGVDQCFLDVVASGGWTSTHRSLATQLHENARRTAADLVRWGRRRRRLTRVLTSAAMVVLADADPASPLPDSLRRRLAAPWALAVGAGPGPRTDSVGAVSLEHGEHGLPHDDQIERE